MGTAALTVIALLGLGAVMGRKKRPSTPKVTVEDDILWADDGSYVIGEQWWANVATPRLQEIVAVLDQSPGTFYADPYAMAYAILEGETGPFQRPTSAYPVPPPDGQAGQWGDVWQTDIPGRPDFYDGPPTVLFLTEHVAQHVAAAFDAYSKGYPLVMTGALDVCPEGFAYDDGTGQCIPTTPEGGMPGVECPPGMVYNVRLDSCVPMEGQ